MPTIATATTAPAEYAALIRALGGNEPASRWPNADYNADLHRRAMGSSDAKNREYCRLGNGAHGKPHTLRPTTHTPPGEMPASERERVVRELEALHRDYDGHDVFEIPGWVSAIDNRHDPQSRSRHGWVSAEQAQLIQTPRESEIDHITTEQLAARLYRARYLLHCPRVWVMRATDAISEAMCAELNCGVPEIGGRLCGCVRDRDTVLALTNGDWHGRWNARDRHPALDQVERFARADCGECHGSGTPEYHYPNGRGLLLATGQRVMIEPAPMLALATVACWECDGEGETEAFDPDPDLFGADLPDLANWPCVECHGTGRVPLLDLCVRAE